MSASDSSQESASAKARWFATTHWSVVLTASDGASPQAAEALENLCRAYWYPLYAYARGKGHSPHDAQDLTQEFFARFLEKNSLNRADRQRGRFRSFLLTSFQNFLAHERDRARTEKRGGGQTFIPWDEQVAEGRYQLDGASDLAPDKIFEQRWAFTLFQQALTRLREESVAAGKVEQFEELKVFLSAEPDAGAYAAVASRLSLSTGAVAVAVHRLRQRYGQLVRAEIAHTVASPAEMEEELRYLIDLVRR